MHPVGVRGAAWSRVGGAGCRGQLVAGPAGSARPGSPCWVPVPVVVRGCFYRHRVSVGSVRAPHIRPQSSGSQRVRPLPLLGAARRVPAGDGVGAAALRACGVPTATGTGAFVPPGGDAAVFVAVRRRRGAARGDSCRWHRRCRVRVTASARCRVPGGVGVTACRHRRNCVTVTDGCRWHGGPEGERSGCALMSPAAPAVRCGAEGPDVRPPPPDPDRDAQGQRRHPAPWGHRGDAQLPSPLATPPARAMCAPSRGSRGRGGGGGEIPAWAAAVTRGSGAERAVPASPMMSPP